MSVGSDSHRVFPSIYQRSVRSVARSRFRELYLMTAMFTGAVVVARNTLLSAMVTIDLKFEIKKDNFLCKYD